jgi:hypothetical protein
MLRDDDQVLELTGASFDRLYECGRRSLLLGTEPS